MSCETAAHRAPGECRAAPAPDDRLAVAVRGVGKCYEIYTRPLDRLKQTLFRGRRRFYREFWALRDVSLEVRRGETLGIIGRNGSGKSTLLQIIAGTLTPSAGEVRVRGRVAALLELGSGFNPEFTGRENVFVNAAILGLSPAETEARLDDIRSFADIGEFFDQPVKTYSSGMVVRLAFAVQAQLTPDVLIVDEALAVGDEGFQRKCYGWLERFQSLGGAILFVTHSTQIVVRLCERAILLDQGRVLAHGTSKPVTDIYQKLLYGTPEECAALRRRLTLVEGRAERVCLGDEPPAPPPGEAASAGPDEPPPPATETAAHYDRNLAASAETVYGMGGAEICDLAICDEAGRRANVFPAGQRAEFRYRVRFSAAAEGVCWGMMIKTVEGIDVAGVSSAHLGCRVARVHPGQELLARFQITLNLAPGTYFLNCGVSAIVDGVETYLHRRVDVAAIRVIPRDRRDLYGLAFTDPELRWQLVESVEKQHV